MKREFIINRQGRDFVLYAGLLDAAHEHGLKDIETTLVQIPDEANGHTAICTATVRLVDAGGVLRTFAATGDANPGNVNRMVAGALIRMAETRAKARALRDAINVAADLLDEVNDAAGSTTTAAQDDPPRSSSGRPDPHDLPGLKAYAATLSSAITAAGDDAGVAPESGTRRRERPRCGASASGRSVPPPPQMDGTRSWGAYVAALEHLLRPASARAPQGAGR